MGPFDHIQSEVPLPDGFVGELHLRSLGCTSAIIVPHPSLTSYLASNGGSMLRDNLRYRDDVPVGWRPMFDQLMADLDALDPFLRVVQAKQKFGELRVYLKTYSETAFEMIDAATRRSRETCEVCGAEGSLRTTRRYYQTLCDIHAGESERAAKSPIHGRFRFGPDGLKSIDTSPRQEGEEP